MISMILFPKQGHNSTLPYGQRLCFSKSPWIVTDANNNLLTQMLNDTHAELESNRRQPVKARQS